MIVVDASAFLAIYFKEPEREGFLAIIVREEAVMSPVNHWEILAKVFREHGQVGVDRAERLRAELGIEIALIGEDQSKRAHEAFARFGKGVGGPLNLGDCFAYALTQVEGDGLLFKGDDFPRTDVQLAI